MDSRTECELETMNNEYSMRVSEKAIIQFLDDYDENERVVDHLLFMKKRWEKQSVVETIIDCIGFTHSFFEDWEGITEDIFALNKAWGTDTKETIKYAITIGLMLHKEAQTQWKELIFKQEKKNE